MKDVLKNLRKSKGYNPGGKRRIYHYHVRKTGGSSLNYMFLALAGGDPEKTYARLARKENNRLVAGGRVYIGWNVSLIERGSFFYAFSHTPAHKIALPNDMFTVTCFRDPVRRVISLYNMLRYYRDNHVAHPCMAVQGKWLGDTFGAFIRNVPPNHLLRQLFMFSKHFDVDEAMENILKTDYFFFTENFNKGVAELNRRIGVTLAPLHIKKAKIAYEVRDSEKDDLRELLGREYDLIGRLRDFKAS
jgi:hypothetical protein